MHQGEKCCEGFKAHRIQEFLVMAENTGGQGTQCLLNTRLLGCALTLNLREAR